MPHKGNKNFLYCLKRRHQSLLEVLIAFALIALCILPMMYPHVAIYKAQNKFIHKVELDHVVNLLYGKILEKLYMNTINWNDLEQTTFPVDAEILKEIQFDGSFYYTGSYNFFEKPPRFKPKNQESYSLYLYRLTFNFIPIEFAKASNEVKESNLIKYHYDIFVVRDLRSSSPQPPNTPTS
jgi:hypothetical protein